MRVAAASPKIKLADCQYNAQAIIDIIHHTNREHVDILVLPEMCITGATCGSLIGQQLLLNAAKDALDAIIFATENSHVAVTVGLPIYHDGKVYQANAVVMGGGLVCLVTKDALTVDMIDGIPIGNSYPFGQIIVNPSNAPSILEEAPTPCRGLCITATPWEGESTTDNVYLGVNTICMNGEVLHQGAGFIMADVPDMAYDLPVAKKGGLKPYDFPMPKGEISPMPFRVKDPAQVLEIQGTALAQRLGHIRAGTAVLGISGGLDSTLALLATAQAFKKLNRPATDIITVTMPGFGTTSHTKNNAQALCKALGTTFMEIDIKNTTASHLADIGHPPDTYDVVFENAQARMRTMVLMNLANQKNGIVVGTGSLSELALGWATYNGDHMSMYAINAGVPKTLARQVVEHVASTDAHLQEVLESILATKVSPELLPAVDDTITQITEDTVGPYVLHDFFIYHALGKYQLEPKAILAMATQAFKGQYDRDTIKHWLRVFYTRFFTQQFKRNCMPDSPQVVGITLSPRIGYQMPSDASPRLWLAQLD